jgi:hypothetical protein
MEGDHDGVQDDEALEGAEGNDGNFGIFRCAAHEDMGERGILYASHLS